MEKGLIWMTCSFRSVLTSPRDNPSDTPENRPSRPNSRNVVRKTARPSSTRSPRSPFSDFSRTKHSSGPTLRGDVGSTTEKANLPMTPLPPDGYRYLDATRRDADGSTEAISGPSSTGPADCGGTSEALPENETFVRKDLFTKSMLTLPKQSSTNQNLRDRSLHLLVGNAIPLSTSPLPSVERKTLHTTQRQTA